MRLLTLLFAGSTLLFAASCNNNTSTTTTSTTADSTTQKAPEAITLADVPASPEFPGAQLSIASMTSTKVGTDSAKLSFTFNVKNYDLKAQTQDAGNKLCNNSDKGQHIHFILDNKPYVALYEPKHEITVPLNGEHYLICFLSRSYHESVKSPGASATAHFKIDANGAMQKMDMPKSPMLFYSRPKGDYIGQDIENVLLDFYPVNTTLGADYKVKADVKNENTGATASFTIDQWKPHFINHLGPGKATVVLTLIDKDGKPVAGPNTSITRSITLSTSEPLK
jgi:hypothetical protein